MRRVLPILLLACGVPTPADDPVVPLPRPRSATDDVDAPSQEFQPALGPLADLVVIPLDLPAGDVHDPYDQVFAFGDRLVMQTEGAVYVTGTDKRGATDLGVDRPTLVRDRVDRDEVVVDVAATPWFEPGVMWFLGVGDVPPLDTGVSFGLPARVWRTDGTASGTEPVGDTLRLAPGLEVSFGRVDGTLVVVQHPPASGRDIDATMATAVLGPSGFTPGPMGTVRTETVGIPLPIGVGGLVARAIEPALAHDALWWVADDGDLRRWDGAATRTLDLGADVPASLELVPTDDAVVALWAAGAVVLAADGSVRARHTWADDDVARTVASDDHVLVFRTLEGERRHVDVVPASGAAPYRVTTSGPASISATSCVQTDDAMVCEGVGGDRYERVWSLTGDPVQLTSHPAPGRHLVGASGPWALFRAGARHEDGYVGWVPWRAPVALGVPVAEARHRPVEGGLVMGEEHPKVWIGVP